MTADMNPYESPRTSAAPAESRGSPPPRPANWYLWFWLGPVIAAILIAASLAAIDAIRTWAAKP